jgi:hypothetical protein
MEIAHIKGEKPSSARYDANMTDDERNAYHNLILLCPTCHKLIDDQPNTYTVEGLHRIKEEHEAWIVNSTKSAIINVGFSELDIVTKHLISNPCRQGNSLIIIPPKEKIDKNGLTNSTEQLILIGMLQVKQVANFIEKADSLSSGFSSSLVSGFVTQYEKLHNKDGLVGDALFEALHEFACNNTNDFKQRAAGLAVLVYLFEKCEVFEK